jgi:hypothetical protein
MVLALSRWRPRHLLIAWTTYWVVTALIALAPAIEAILRRVVPAGAHGNVNASFNDGLLSLTVDGGGMTAWSGSTHLSTVILWASVPPLLLWLLWLVTRPWHGGRREATGQAAGPPGLRGDAQQTVLPLQAPGAEPVDVRTPERTQARRDRAV